MWTAPEIPAPDETARNAAAERQDQLTKPPGALGRLEALSLQLAAIQGRERPQCERARVLVCAGDHGVCAQGVSAFPAEVTPQMCANFVAGGAAVNVLAGQAGATVEVLDVGVAVDLPPAAGLTVRKVARGTADFTAGPAMTADQCTAALTAGSQRAIAAAEDGCQALCLGEMGIGNTTAAAALLAATFGWTGQEACGRGTGVDDAGLARKVAAVDAGLALHAAHLADPSSRLARLGGLEIAALAGAAIAAANHRLVVVVDGFIATAAVAVARELAPGLDPYLVFGHVGGEKAHRAALERLGGEPLLALGLRLGEGTGAVLALHLLRAACRTLDDMATFAEAGVAQ